MGACLDLEGRPRHDRSPITPDSIGLHTRMRVTGRFHRTRGRGVDVETGGGCASPRPCVPQVMIYDEVNAATKKVEVKCFVLFKEPAAAVRAQKALHGKNFGPRRVSCEFFPEADFQKILES